jgi:hypothetical protein
MREYRKEAINDNTIGVREVGIEERLVAISLSLSGSSGMQVLESRVSKGPSGNGKPFHPVVDFQAGEENHCHATLHRVPGTILGSSG